LECRGICTSKLAREGTGTISRIAAGRRSCAAARYCHFLGLPECFVCQHTYQGVRHVIPEQMIQSGHKSDGFVGNCSLLDMYPECAGMHNAWGVFFKMAITQCYLLDYYDVGTCEKFGQQQKELELF